jgi:hypothetical protein
MAGSVRGRKGVRHRSIDRWVPPGVSADDLNRDGVICLATKGHRTVHSDDRP